MDIIATLTQEFAAILARLRGEGERATSLMDLRYQVQLQLEAALPEQYPWVIDLYDDNGALVAIVSMGGRLYRAPVAINGTSASIGALEEVETYFLPARGRLSIIRQADGAVRWFAQAASAVLNRVSEIDSRSLFDSFVVRAEETGQFPVLRFFHQPGLDFGQADWLGRDGYLYLASGLLDMAHPLAQALVDAVEQGRGRWGCSIGFLADGSELVDIADGVRVPVYTAGINREISVLPEADAASWFTGIGLEVNRMNASIKKALVDLFGDEEKAQEFIAGVDETNRSIEEQGLITRQDESAATPDPDGAPAAEPVEVEQHATTDAEKEAKASADAKAQSEADLLAKFMDKAGIAGLEERLAKLEEAITKLAGKDEERMQERTNIDTRLAAVEIVLGRWQREREADMPARPTLAATYRPRVENTSAGPFTTDAAAAKTLGALKK